MTQIQITQINNGWVVGVTGTNPLTKQADQRAIYCKDIKEVVALIESMDK